MKISQFFDTEYKRASVSSFVTQAVRFVLAYVVLKDTDSSPYIDTMLLAIFSHMLHYVLDVYVAIDFKDNTLAAKTSWMGKSFVNFIFTKYIVVIFLHSMLSATLYAYIKNEVSKFKVNHKWIDLLIWFVINVVSNGLYMYFIKFKWAYQEVNDPIASLIILSWCSLSFMIFMTGRKR